MRKILVVVDMQNDFIDGSLGTKEAQAIVDAVERKIITEMANGALVVFTRDTHSDNYENTLEGKNLPVRHCIYKTHGWEIYHKLQKFIDSDPRSIVWDKPTFGSKDLACFIEGNEPDEVELVGLCTDICVLSNAILAKAAWPEAVVSVDAHCCAGVTPESHRTALEAMKMCQIVIRNEANE